MAKDNKKNADAKNAQAKKNTSKSGGKKPGPVQEKKLNPVQKLFEYFQGVVAELKRVTWPSREKVIYLVGVVVVTLLFFASFTAVIDWASSEGIVALNSITHDPPPPGTGTEVPVQIDTAELEALLGDGAGTEGVVEDDATEVVVGGDEANGDAPTDDNATDGDATE